LWVAAVLRFDYLPTLFAREELLDVSTGFKTPSAFPESPEHVNFLLWLISLLTSVCRCIVRLFIVFLTALYYYFLIG
jgi:hypothetical protein